MAASGRAIERVSLGGLLPPLGCSLTGAKATDWEDLALGPGPTAGESYLYVGDIGDHGTSRDDVRVYRVAEPKTDPAAFFGTSTLTGVERFIFVYPDKAHNAETLLVDPLTGDLYIVVKAGRGGSPVFRAKAPLSSNGKTTLELVTTLAFGEAPLAGDTTTTGGDLSPARDQLTVRTYKSAFAWRRAPGATLDEALATPPCTIPTSAGGQGETLGFAADGKGYYSLNEGTFQPLKFYAEK